MTEIAEPRELVLDRLLDAPRMNVWRCWTEPELLKPWFCPKPWSVSESVIDLRPGGAFNTTMRSPEGQETLNPGQYLIVEPGRRLVFTDAFVGDWKPREGAPFMAAEILLADENGKTRYIATARHWTMETRAQHEAMGFHTGWGVAADQLEAFARTI